MYTCAVLTQDSALSLVFNVVLKNTTQIKQIRMLPWFISITNSVSIKCVKKTKNKRAQRALERSPETEDF